MYAYERIYLLIQQSRYEMAQRDLVQQLTLEPDDPKAHALLALCLGEQDQYSEAFQHIHKAISLVPTNPFFFYILASLETQRDQLQAAEKAIQEALRLNPREADYYHLQGNIHLLRYEWKEALHMAREGLALDPEHVACSNLQGMALIKLGKAEAAIQTLKSALYREPENALTHANQGWTLLEKGQYKAALPHFREALRLNPTMDWAREGLVEALKAHYPLYRWILRYFFFMSRFNRRYRFVIIVLILLGIRVLLSLAAPGIVMGLILGLYFSFVLLTWVSDPLFNLLLRFNPDGRLALSPRQLKASNWTALLLIFAIVAGLNAFFLPSFILTLAAIIAITMIIPITNTIAVENKKSQLILGVYSCTLGFIAISALLLGAWDFIHPLFSNIALVFLIGYALLWVAFSWIANLVRQ